MKISLKNLLLIVSLIGCMTLYAEVTNIKVHENGNDNIDNWVIFDHWPSGAVVENIIESEQEHIIRFTGRKLQNGVEYLGWEDNNNLLQWRMKADEWNAFYVVIQTSKGERLLTYSPRSYDKGIDPTNNIKIKFGLSTKMKDGEWHTFKRNLESDLKKFELDNNFLYIDGIQFRGTASFDNIQTMRESDDTNNLVKKLKPIYIIGASTVHAATYKSNDNTNRTLEGWGEQLDFYMKNDDLVKNRARFGSYATTYFDKPKIEDYPEKWHPYYTEGIKNRYWDFTKKLMSEEPTKGFLLIQFGVGYKSTNKEEFTKNITTYIKETRELGFTPVLISSLNHRLLRATRGDTPLWLKEIAEDKNNPLLFLDLNKKSLDVFRHDYTQDDVTPFYENGKLQHNRIRKADKLYGYEEYEKGGWEILKGINNVHLSPKGARIVAGWVKELACDTNNTHPDREKLCSQFR